MCAFDLKESLEDNVKTNSSFTRALPFCVRSSQTVRILPLHTSIVESS